MSHFSLYNQVKKALSQSEFISSDGEFLTGKIFEAIESLDKIFLSSLLKEQTTKEHFFDKIDDAIVLNQNKLFDFFNAKEYFDSSFTSYTPKIGLIRKDSFIKKFDDTVLSWPYKDCVLEGGMSSEDAGKKEIFYNTIISKDEIDRLFEPKILTNIKRYSVRPEPVEGLIYGSTSSPRLVNQFCEESLPTEITLDDNLILKGNNLLALHSLKERYIGQNGGKIKLIYIDPPYNTGNDGFKYNDRFNHSTWLTFMKNRLEVARELLRDDGSIFISIDNNEVGHLNVLMDEIFGTDNKRNLITVKRSSVSGAKVINSGLVNVSEFIIIYSKHPKQWNTNKIFRKKELDYRYGTYIKNYDELFEKWEYCSVLEAFSKSLNIEKSKLKKYFGDSYLYEIERFYFNNSKRIIQFASIDEKASSNDVVNVKNKSLEDFSKTFIFKREKFSDYYIYKGKVILFFADRLVDIDGEKVFAELIHDIWDDVLPNDLHNEGGISFKKGKKPEKLIQRIIELSTNEGDIVLDYHLGSGTTAAVAHKMNRRYIGIEQMDYIETISVERLKKVIEGEQGGISKAVGWNGGGSFIYAELRETDNFNETDTIGRLNENMRYLPIGEIDDESYGVSDEEKRLNKQFYGVV